MGIAFATLNLEGTIPVDKEVLKEVARGTDITLLRILSIFTGILYGPVALSDFRWLISFSIWIGVTGNIQKFLHEGFLRYSNGDLLTSGTNLTKLTPTFAK